MQTEQAEGVRGLVSIIMGIYNCADTLEEAIDSILAQTYENWELIICDDGSSDNTYAVAETYQKRFPSKIKLLKNEKNEGLNHTLNRCLEQAHGEFIARMDGDDISLPERLETELDVLEAEPDIAAVSCPMIYFDEDGEWRRGTVTAEYPDTKLLIHRTAHCHAPCMIRANVIRSIGGYTEAKGLLRVEDWHMWIKMYAAGYKGKNIDAYLYKMRDDRKAVNRRKLRYRINEARVSVIATNTFHFSKWNYVFALRPILVGALPKPVYTFLRRAVKR